MTIQQRWYPVGDGGAVQRASITVTADKSFLEHASVGLVQQFHDGHWGKGVTDGGFYP